MPPKKSDFSNLWVSQYTNPYILVNVGQKKFQVDKLNEITLRASGKAIPNACLICEQLKRRVKNLHQINNISNSILEIQSQDKRTYKRTITCLEILLSRTQVNDQHYGYQPPIDFNLVDESNQENQNQQDNRQQQDRNRQQGLRKQDDRNQQRDQRPQKQEENQNQRVQQEGNRQRDERPQQRGDQKQNQRGDNKPQQRGDDRPQQRGDDRPQQREDDRPQQRQDDRPQKRGDGQQQRGDNRNNQTRNQQFEPKNSGSRGNNPDNQRTSNRQYSPENVKTEHTNKYNPRINNQRGGRYNSVERNRDRNLDQNAQTTRQTPKRNEDTRTQAIESIEPRKPEQRGGGYIRRGGPRKNNEAGQRKVEYIQKNAQEEETKQEI